MSEQEFRDALSAMDLRVTDLTSSAEAREKENADLRSEIERLRSQTTTTTSPSSTMPSLIDTRMMSKPTTFSGAMDQWADWSFVFKAYCAAINPRMIEVMRHAQESDTMIVTTNVVDHNLSSQLYYILALMVKDRALVKLRTAPQGNGFECWRLFCAEWEPKQPC